MGKILFIVSLATTLFLMGCQQQISSPSKEVSELPLAPEKHGEMIPEEEPKMEPGDTPPPVEEVTKVIVKRLPPANYKEARFDGCGKAVDYEDSEWFDGFLTAVYDFNFSDEKKFEPEIAEGLTKGVSELCYSADASLVIATISDAYCRLGNLVRYDIENDFLEESSYNGVDLDTCNAQFSEFGKRSGSIVPVTAVFGDAGCVGYTYYDYDYIQNTATKTRTCFGCYNQIDEDEELELECEDI